MDVLSTLVIVVVAASSVLVVLHRAHGVHALLSSSSCLGICHGHLVVFIFLDLGWTHCHRHHSGGHGCVINIRTPPNDLRTENSPHMTEIDACKPAI